MVPLTIPNILTLLRMAAIPVMVVCFYLPWDSAHVASAMIFGIAGITDWLDGYLARKLEQTSAFGAFLDPVADKLMVAVALVLTLQADPTPALALASAVIIGREIAVAALREWMAELGQRKKVEVVWIAKVKTTAQMFAIVALLVGLDVREFPVRELGYVSIYLAAVLTLWSMMGYLRAAIPSFTDEPAQR